MDSDDYNSSSYGHQGQQNRQQQQHHANGGELLSSAKVLSDAVLHHENTDRNKVAEAAANVLDTAGQYGKLDETKGIGKYADMAADYLHQFETSAGNTAHSGGGHHDKTDDQSVHGGRRPEAGHHGVAGGGYNDENYSDSEHGGRPSKTGHHGGGYGDGGGSIGGYGN